MTFDEAKEVHIRRWHEANKALLVILEDDLHTNEESKPMREVKALRGSIEADIFALKHARYAVR